MHTENYLRHSDLSRQLLDSWTFHWEIVIVNIIRLGTVSHSNKQTPIYSISSISFVSLENPNTGVVCFYLSNVFKYNPVVNIKSLQLSM